MALRAYWTGCLERSVSKQRKQLVLMYWDDIQGDAGWGDKVFPLKCVSAGWIVQRPTKKAPFYRLADTLSNSGPGGVQAIPRGCVTKIVLLRSVLVPPSP
jgi:hypothetical protein